MKFILKTFFIYLFIFVQSLIPIAREVSFLPKVITNSSAIAMDCDDDGSCAVDLTEGEDEDGRAYDSKSGYEGSGCLA